MRSHSKPLCFITATLLLSLASPLLAVTPEREFAISQAQTAQNRKAEAEQLLLVAEKQLAEGQYQKVLESFQKALAIYQEIGVSEANPKEIRGQVRTILFMMVFVSQELGQYEQVLKYSQQVLAIDRELGEHCQEQETLLRISSVYGVLGQYDQVLEGLEKTLALHRELDEPCGKPYFSSL